MSGKRKILHGGVILYKRHTVLPWDAGNGQGREDRPAEIATN